MAKRKSRLQDENEKAAASKLRELSKWLDSIELADGKNDEMLGYNIRAPYSDARRPKQTQWKEN